ncbi:MAG TPA: extracellular solute-binding protein [Gaiellaceae bacterium]
MRSRIFVAALAAVALGVVAATASAGVQHAQAGKITVWLQVDAQSGWPDVVAAANAQFQQDHPGTTVDVQYQNWGDHLQKFDATLAGGNTPDVIEMGNTETTKYMAAGAFADLTSMKGTFANSSNWLSGLAKSGMYGGKLYAVPYYAGSRVVTYRTDSWKKAGISKLPSSLAQFNADNRILAAKNKSTKGFSPVYVAGTDWYFAMSFVYDYGGSIARTHAGKWIGNLNSKASIAGLTAWKNFFKGASKAPATSDESKPAPYDVYSQGGAASIIGPGWYSCCVGTKFKSTTAQFVMPSHTKGQPMPGFLGGSDLAVPAPSKNVALGADWIKDFTSTSAERSLQAKGNIPNATSLLGTSVNERAAARSWFVPAAKHWVDVENGNILRNMLAQILIGKLTVAQAASSASDNITSVLNGA